MTRKALEKMADKIEVERIKLLFAIDEAMKELRDLTPGRTQGEEGLKLALFIDEAMVTANDLAKAYDRIQRLLEYTG